MQFSPVVAAAVALFSVFGFLSAVRTLVGLFLSERRIVQAVEVRDARDAAELQELLEEASANAPTRGCATVVLLSADLMDGTVGDGEELLEEYDELLWRYGAECYLVDF